MFAGASLDENSGAFCELKANFFRLILTKAEVGGLQWGDIDFTNRFISIKRSLSYQYEDGVKTIFFTSPKTENSVRKIPFFGETKDILMRQFEKQKAKRADMGKKWKQPQRYGRSDIYYIIRNSNRSLYD